MTTPRLIRSLPGILLFFSVSSLSCRMEGTDGARPPFVVWDSAGVAIAVSRVPVWSNRTAWRLAESPNLELGGSNGEGEIRFVRITGAFELPDRSVVVSNQTHPPEIRAFDQTGDEVWAFGRTGGGPGEFHGIAWTLFAPPDTLISYDFWDARLTYSDLGGDFLGSASLTGETTGGSWGSVALHGRFGNGGFLARPNLRLPLNVKEGGVSVSPALVLRIDGKGSGVDTIGFFLDTEFTVVEGRAERPAFGKRAAFLANDSVLITGFGERYEFDEYSLSGVHLRRFRRDFHPRPVTKEMLASQSANGPSGQSRIRSGKGDRLELKHRNLPAYSRRLLVDTPGNLWVQGHPAPKDTVIAWSVFDGERRFLGEFEVPIQLRITSIGDSRLIGVWKNDMDVETVRRYRVIKPSG